MTSPYHTRSQAAATSVPPPLPRHHQIIAQLCPHEDLAPATEPPALPVPTHVANPLASPVAPHSPLELLFLGMDDDMVIPSPPPSPFLVPPPALGGSDYSPASPEIDLYEVDVRHPAPEMSTPEHQVAWEAELARSPTPPPAADNIIDMVLEVSCTGTLVFCPGVQPLTPPPHWMGHRTPPPPPPDCHLPTNGEIARWSKRFFVAKLMAQIAD
ncbi:hypothetical protein NDA11_003320 [Ustilago hordei]|nr:hypothetical protein NDA11_003320 [Ustilago hordei]